MIEMPETGIRKINEQAIALEDNIYYKDKSEATFEFAEMILNFKEKINLATLDFNGQHDVLNNITKDLKIFDDISALYKRDTRKENLGEGTSYGNDNLNEVKTENLKVRIKKNIEKLFETYAITLDNDIFDDLLKRLKEKLAKEDLSEINLKEEISIILKTNTGEDCQIEL